VLSLNDESGNEMVVDCPECSRLIERRERFRSESESAVSRLNARVRKASASVFAHLLKTADQARAAYERALEDLDQHQSQHEQAGDKA
jgi:hypothetical protein